MAEPIDNDLADLFGADDDEEEEQVPQQPSPKRARTEAQPEPAPQPQAQAQAQPQAQRRQDDSEDDAPEEGPTAEDALFIDDTGTEAVDYQDDVDNNLSEAEEEQEDEITRIFTQKKRKRADKSMSQIKDEVVGLMTRLETAAELDADSVSRQQPAVHKLMMLKDIQNVIAQKSLHRYFMDAGLLDVLRMWLELLPDRTLPNIKIRTAVLQLLTALQIDLTDEQRKRQLTTSGVGKVVMFLSKLPDETPANRRLAKAMVQAWFTQINAQHRDPRSRDQEQERSEREAHNRAVRLQAQRANAIAAVNPNEDPDGLDERGRRALKPGDDGFRFHASIPQAARMDYLRKPEGKAADLMVKQRGPKGQGSALSKHVAKLGRSGKTAKPGKISVQGRDLAV